MLHYGGDNKAYSYRAWCEVQYIVLKVAICLLVGGNAWGTMFTASNVRSFPVYSSVEADKKVSSAKSVRQHHMVIMPSHTGTSYGDWDKVRAEVITVSDSLSGVDHCMRLYCDWYSRIRRDYLPHSITASRSSLAILFIAGVTAKYTKRNQKASPYKNKWFIAGTVLAAALPLIVSNGYATLDNRWKRYEDDLFPEEVRRHIVKVMGSYGDLYCSKKMISIQDLLAKNGLLFTLCAPMYKTVNGLHNHVNIDTTVDQIVYGAESLPYAVMVAFLRSSCCQAASLWLPELKDTGLQALAVLLYNHDSKRFDVTKDSNISTRTAQDVLNMDRILYCAKPSTAGEGGDAD